MANDSIPPSRGICYLVGAGPGDPGLVTLRARECIEAAEVIAYDYLVNKELLLWAKPGVEMIYVGKQADQHTLEQSKINQLLVKRVREGKIVTRLKGGDPMVFGRGGEEAEELAEAGCAFEMVPGISSTIAGPAYAGIPVTHRAHNAQLTIFTGHEDPDKEESSLDFAKLAAADGVKVMLMGVGRIAELMTKFISHGASPATPVALVRWATTGRQQTLTGTMATIADAVKAANFKAPAVCIMGTNVNLREKLRWFDNRPLFGKRIVVTRTRDQAGQLSRRLKALGADVIEIPTIRIEPPMNRMAFGECVEDAHKFDWLVFSSPNGAAAFFDLFFKIYRDAREIGGCRIAAIGPGTEKKIKEYHLSVDFIPEESVAESFVDEFIEHYGSVANQTFLWVRAEDARPVIAKELNKHGGIVDEAIAYRTVPERDDITGGQARLRDEGADMITFASSSAVENFLNLKLPLPENVKIASIGPVTSRTLHARGLVVDVEADRHDIAGFTEAICRHFIPE
ncbi:MAG: uroporphyrinogen-III C-methyltransferase [Verrucomicrobiales bacterium]|nr:uroporphyrinogen-III C-methyltransferase [Verrucomicrobiales bacterium]